MQNTLATPITSDKLPISSLPYSPAVAVAPFVFISGQASVDDNGQIKSGSFAEEFKLSMRNLERVLAVSGLTLDDVVQVRSYVGRQEDVPEYNALYCEYFQKPYPARTTLIGCLGDVLKYEIDVVAVARANKGNAK